MTIESLMLSCMIDAQERCKTETVEISGAFRHANMEELVHINFERVMDEMLVKI